MKVFVADGEKAEPLGARFSKARLLAQLLFVARRQKDCTPMCRLKAKSKSCQMVFVPCWIVLKNWNLALCKPLFQEQGTLPSLKAIVRCGCHSGTKALENALSCDERIERLVTLLINGYSTGHGESGGLARAIRNSSKLKGRLQEEHAATARTTDEILGRLLSMRFAPQRFGTLCDVATQILLNVKSLFGMLIKMDTPWSHKLLTEVFQPKKLLLLAMVAEMSAAAMRFVRKLDNSCAFAAAQVGQAVEQLVDDLFSFKSADGSMREPLVLDRTFTMGFVQLLGREFRVYVSKVFRFFWHLKRTSNHVLLSTGLQSAISYPRRHCRGSIC